MTDRYAVVGNPVAHSLSPRIHAAFAAATGEPISYTTLLAPADGFVATVERFLAEGGAGLNVTVPFKEQAAAWVGDLDPAARLAGAVNTIVRDGPNWRGHNTDGAGLVRDLQTCGVRLRDATVVLVGAGGAARGALGPLLASGPRHLTVVNRSAGRAVELVARFGDAAGGVSLSGGGLELAPAAVDVLVNATSAGLGSDPQAPALAPSAARGAVCYDMMYGDPRQPAATAFCRWAETNGAARVHDGLGMLVEQAALAFALWRGRQPATAPVLELLRRGSV